MASLIMRLMRTVWCTMPSVRERVLLMRVIRRPPVAMRHFVLADLRLDPGGDRPPDPGDQDKATARIHHGAAQRAMDTIPCMV